MKTKHHPMQLCLLTALALATFSSQLSPVSAAPTVTKVSTGIDHTLFIESDGSLWGMGSSMQGQLGLGFGVGSNFLPQQILYSNVTAVAAGDGHSLFLEADGSLHTMGFNYYGELGDGTTNNYYFPEQIESSHVTSIAAGAFHSLFRTSVTSGSFPFITTTVSILAMGDGRFGQLSDGSPDNQSSPLPGQSTDFLLDEVTSMAAGGYHSLFIRFDGSLWASGKNTYGELGTGGNRDQYSAVEIETNNVIAVAGGLYHSLFVKSDGSLWAMGYNNSGQLGDNSTTDHRPPEQVGVNVVAVAAGEYHSLFLKSDSSLWGMGSNTNGQLGMGLVGNELIPVEIVSSNVTAIAAGGYRSFFIKTDGTLWGMGDNTSGCLGDGTGQPRNIPVQIVPLVLPQPAVTTITLSHTNLIVQASNGQSGRTYFTLMSTDLAKPVNQWTPVATNVSSSDGNFTFTATNVVIAGTPQQFYLLQPQN
jgi:alpha-tubulin suppressor-like RCC1 family protein